MTLDGQEVTNAQMGEIHKDGKYYAITWKANIGVLSNGTHELTYNRLYPK